MLIWLKNFFFAKYGYQNNAEFDTDFETVEKNVKNLLRKTLQPKKVWKIRGILSILLTCKSVWQITFSGWIFRLFPQIWNQRKILRNLNTHMPKRNKQIFGAIEYIYEYMLELVECKFPRNGWTNWKTFLTNIFENIIWHLFAGESHQVVKINVPTVHLLEHNFKVYHALTCLKLY